MTRSIALQDILKIQSRARSRHIGFSHDIQELQSLWDAKIASLDDFTDFIPVRLVTLLENAIRVAVKQLVDFGTPFSGRGINILARGSIKDSATLLAAIHTDQVSLGNLVAHSISTNDVGNVISAFELLNGNDFKQRIALVRDRVEVELFQKPDEPIMSGLNQTLGILSRMLQVRHIVIHEIPAEPPYQFDDLGRFIDHTYKFVAALEWLVTELLFGKVPLTQTDMNIEQGKRATEARGRLDGVLTKITENIDDLEVREHFLKTQQTWETFIKLQADERAGRVGEHAKFPGSMAPLRYACEIEARINERIVDLETHYAADGSVKEAY
jgi:hypothetical protein